MAERDLPAEFQARKDAGWRHHLRGYVQVEGRRFPVADCACAFAANGEWLPDPSCPRCRGFGVIFKSDQNGAE